MKMKYLIPNGNRQNLTKETFGGTIFQINASSHFFRTSSDGILAGTDGILAGTDGILAGTDGILAGTDGILARTDGILGGTDGILASIKEGKEAQKMSFQAEITIKININN